MSGYTWDPMLWPTLGSAAFIGTIVVYLWRRRRDTRGAFTLALLGSLLVVWCLAAAAEVAAIDVATQRGWYTFRDALTLPGVVFGFWFALQYAGLDRWLTRPVVAFLVVVTVAHVLLDLIDGGRFLWSNIWWDREIQGDRGPLGMAFAAIAITMFLLSTAVFLLLFARSPAHRVPVALILVGQVALRVLYPLVAFDITYVPNIVSGVIGFDFVTAMYAVALFRFRLFELVPVARNLILERIPDAMLVIDTGDRIADLNDAAARLVELPRVRVLGRPASAVLAGFPDLARRVLQATEPTAEVTLDTPTGMRTCELSSTPLSDWQGRSIGRLILLHDITALRSVEAQLVDRERTLAAAQERERLARELHDGLAQDLWLAKLKTGRLAALTDLGSEARALTDELAAAIDTGIVEARQAVATMRLGVADHDSLRALLSRSLEDFEDRFALPVELECDGTMPALTPRVEAEALRIVQEALTNVRRHADATLVRVRATVDEAGLVLVVGDNGRGFDPAAAAKVGSYGLTGMRERANLIGGELQIDSAPSSGTRVRLMVPVARAVAVGAGVQ